MPKRIFLTIRGVSRTISDWTLQPGAAPHSTISWRIKHSGWTPEAAVFMPSLKIGRHGVERPKRTRVKRAAVVLAPNPKVANPNPPTWGRYSSWPIEALEMLRRCA